MPRDKKPRVVLAPRPVGILLGWVGELVCWLRERIWTVTIVFMYGRLVAPTGGIGDGSLLHFRDGFGVPEQGLIVCRIGEFPNVFSGARHTLIFLEVKENYRLEHYSETAIRPD